MKNRKIIFLIVLIFLIMIACDLSDFSFLMDESTTNEGNSDSPSISLDFYNENEPVIITGTIPYTSPFFLTFASEPFVLLEDQAGFYNRDYDFEFALESQVIGPAWEIDENTLGFSISLPTIPQATLLDLDNDSEDDLGVMVFAVAMWSNIWGDPFLEPREGTGWSNAHSSAIADKENDNELIGGHLVIWAPDDQQEFPTGFGEDGLLFTDDDPVAQIPAGYSIVDLDQEVFSIYKEPTPEFILEEGPSAINDYSDLSYVEAFDLMFEKISIEYPFTVEKDINWAELYVTFLPLIQDVNNDAEFSNVIRLFTNNFPDAHVGLTFNSDAFVLEAGGSFGMMLKELSNGSIIVTKIYAGYQAAQNGIQVGAEIITWDGLPVNDAINNVIPFTGPFSTEHHKRFEQVNFLARYEEGRKIDVVFRNPNGNQQTATMTAEFEVNSFLDSLPYITADPLNLPVEAETLENGFTYIKIETFSGDLALMTRVWDHYIDNMLENDSHGLIIDIRSNYGGSGGIAAGFASYFIEKEIEVGKHSYYNENLEEFVFLRDDAFLEPAPVYYVKPVVVLVNHDCISACEGFVYYMSLNDHTTIIGHTPTAGAFGEVGQGQYKLPGEIDVQFPTGKPITPDGDLLIEGTGITPDIIVPITVESALGQVDAVLEAAIDLLISITY